MDDHEICNLISLSVGAVMRQSINDAFKEQCKAALGAAETKSVEEILEKKLKRIIGEAEPAETYVDNSNSLPAQEVCPICTVEGNEDKTSEVLDQESFETVSYQVLAHAVPSNSQNLSDDESDLMWE